jgi:hypothetical protein
MRVDGVDILDGGSERGGRDGVSTVENKKTTINEPASADTVVREYRSWFVQGSSNMQGIYQGGPYVSHSQ